MKREGQITVVIDPKVKRAIEKLARDDDRSLSNYINRVLASHVNSQAQTDSKAA